MTLYVTLFNLTDKGVKDVKNAPQRIKEGLKGFEALGGKILGFYAVMGEYDYVSIGEAPSDEVAMTYMMAVGSLGFVRTKSLKAFTIEEFSAMVGNLP